VGVANLQSKGKEAQGVGNSTVGKSVGEFLSNSVRYSVLHSVPTTTGPVGPYRCVQDQCVCVVGNHGCRYIHSIDCCVEDRHGRRGSPINSSTD